MPDRGDGYPCTPYVPWYRRPSDAMHGLVESTFSIHPYGVRTQYSAYSVCRPGSHAWPGPAAVRGPGRTPEPDTYSYLGCFVHERHARTHVKTHTMRQFTLPKLQ